MDSPDTQPPVPAGPTASVSGPARRRIFITLFFTLFSTITGVGMVVPLLPVYAEALGAAGLQVGLIFGAFSLTRAAFLPLFGRMSDQHGRKPFILAGLGGYTLVSVSFIAGGSVWSLITIRFFQGIASAMIMPVVQAYVGEISPPGREGYTMGLFNMSLFASLSLGPVMGGVLTDLWSMDAAFACMGILSFCGLGLSLVFLPPVSREPIQPGSAPALEWGPLIRTPLLVGIFAFRFAYTAGISVIWCFIPLFAQHRFDLSGASTGILVTLGVFISGVLQMPMGWLADRFSKSILVISGGLLCAAALVLIYFTVSYRQLIAAVSLFGLGGGISMPAIMAMGVIIGQEKHAMASVISILTVAHSAGMMVGAMAAGAAMDWFSLANVFPLGGGMMFIGLLTFVVCTWMKSETRALDPKTPVP